VSKKNKPHKAGERGTGRAPGAARADRRRTAIVCWGLLLCLLAVYHVNGDFLIGNDSKPNMYLAVSVLNEGNLSFTPREMPFMFRWKLDTPGGKVDTTVRHWRTPINGKKPEDLYRAGALSVDGPMYYLVPSVREGLYVNQYGPGAGLCGLPVATIMHLVTGDLAANTKALWYGAKFTASAMVAGSAVFVFLAGLAFTTRPRALLVAGAYGLGTCVWSTSSQALWQHGPNEFFLALGLLLLTRIRAGNRFAALCGLACAAAVVCRPTSAILAAAIGIYLLIADRKAMLWYLLGALPLAVLMGAYNQYYLGSPFEFGQFAGSAGVAARQIGSRDIWQARPWVGAAGTLFSPSRGLMIYSPFIALALVGAIAAWRRKELSALRPLTVAVVAELCLVSCYFNWWAGWSYGPRYLADTGPAMALLLMPAMSWILHRKAVAAIFAVLLAWSVCVQVVGAFAYNVVGWNGRLAGYEVRLAGQSAPVLADDETQVRRILRSSGPGKVVPVLLDIDQPEHRHRLWSVGDSQILYYIRHFTESRKQKKRQSQQALEDPAS